MDATLTHARPGSNRGHYSYHTVDGTLMPSVAALTGLTLSGITLSPSFSSGTTFYTATAGSTVAETTVTATPETGTDVIHPAGRFGHGNGRAPGRAGTGPQRNHGHGHQHGERTAHLHRGGGGPLGGDRGADDIGPGAGGQGPDGLDGGHLRRVRQDEGGDRRYGLRLHLPVGAGGRRGRERHTRCHRADLHGCGGGRGPRPSR